MLRAALIGLLLLVAVAAVAAPGTAASDAPDGGGVELVRFVGEGCPTCAEQSAWLAEVAPRYPGLEVVEHEVWSDAQARGERVWIGWTDAIAEDLTAALDRAAAGDAVSPGVYGTPGAGTCSQDALACEGSGGPVVDVPLLGEVDLPL